MATPVAVLPSPQADPLFRAYPFPDSYDDRSGKPVHKLFYRRAHETGLSVCLNVEAIQIRMPEACGYCSVGYQAIEECPDQIYFVQDAIDHGEIQGIPLRDEDKEKAIRIAKHLARAATHVRMY